MTAVGNAKGTGHLVHSRGSVTAIDETSTIVNSKAILTDTSETLTGLIKSSAHTVGGYSGGPLLDASGRVVDIDVSGAEKLGAVHLPYTHSIPVDRALAVVAQIHAGVSNDTVHVGPTTFLGILTGFAYHGGGPVEGCVDVYYAGECVKGVLPGGPASTLGLFVPAVINSLAGQYVTSHADVVRILNTRVPGENVQVQWLTPDAKSHTGAVTLAEGPPL